MNDELNIPTDGIRNDKITEFKNLIGRYISENDEYNSKAIHGGLFPALNAVHTNKTMLEIIRSMNSELTIFQLNWVLNVLSEYSKRSKEIKKFWEMYQQTLEPKKKSKRCKQSDEDPSELPLDYIDLLS